MKEDIIPKVSKREADVWKVTWKPSHSRQMTMTGLVYWTEHEGRYHLLTPKGYYIIHPDDILVARRQGGS